MPDASARLPALPRLVLPVAARPAQKEARHRSTPRVRDTTWRVRRDECSGEPTDRSQAWL